MAKSIITFRQNGDIELMHIKLGVWGYEDVWGKEGKRNKSGCRLVKGLWHAYLIDGSHVIDYTREEVKKTITLYAFDLVKVAKTLTEEQKQLNISNA